MTLENEMWVERSITCNYFDFLEYLENNNIDKCDTKAIERTIRKRFDIPNDYNFDHIETDDYGENVDCESSVSIGFIKTMEKIR